jgi:DNA helicase IV
MRFPSFQDLSEEQRKVYDLPLSRDYLVTGPPGTGKTVIALHRASMLAASGKQPSVLALSRLLTRYADGAAASIDLTACLRTYNSWLGSFYRSCTGKSLPEKGGKYDYDWDQILVEMLDKGINQSAAHKPVLVVDEGQDLPPGFYQTMDYFKQSITVFADENQRITLQQSTFNDIRQALQLEAEQEYCLTYNYRNTKEIAQVAACFYSGLQSGIPAFPDRTGDKPRAKQVKKEQEFIDFLIRFEHNFSDLTIGVFTSNLTAQQRIQGLLTGHTVKPVEAYAYNVPAIPDLDRAGIKLIQMNSAKGLEFDAVFIPNIHWVSHAELEKPDTAMKYYVLLSRARTYLYLFFEGKVDNLPLLRRIPQDLLDWQ